MAANPQPYRQAARLYTRAGWVGVLPLPLRSKQLRLCGWTGHTGTWPSGADVQAWADSDAASEGGGNIALRLPRGVLGIDVDAYDAKPGAATLLGAEQRWGPLPATWRTTSRDDGISGIRLYQVPEGLAWPGQLGPGTELIQYSHRYALVWPSIHPQGRTYRWITPGGGVAADIVPSPEQLPALPEIWVAGLTAGQPTEHHTKAELGVDATQAWLLAAPGGTPCRRMHGVLQRALTALCTGSRHEAARDHVLRLVRLGQEHHHGLASALAQLHAGFLAAMHDPHRAPGRSDEQARAEWWRILSGAVALVVANPGAASATGPDPCQDPFSDLVAAPVTPLHPNGTSPPETPQATEPDAAQRMHDHAVSLELSKLRVRSEARRQFAAEQIGHITAPTPVGLAELLVEPDETTEYRVDGLWPVDGRMILAAQYKAGKTTMVGNLLRCLADGTPFLGNHQTTRPTGRIVILDTEMSRGTLRRWLRDQKIIEVDQISVIVLRGRVGSFNILDPTIRAQWVATLRDLNPGLIILDCLRPILDALGLDENHDVGRVLVALDELTDQAGATELAVVHHMGHTGERSRGDSRLRDWPDVEWRLVRQDDDPASPRFLSAYGRDVDMPETALHFDPGTRHLTIADTGGSRKTVAEKAASVAAVSAVLDLLGRSPALSSQAIEAALMPTGHKRADVRAAIRTTLERHQVIEEPGPRGAKTHYLAPSLEDLVASASSPPARTSPTSPTSPDLAGHASARSHTTSPTSPPAKTHTDVITNRSNRSGELVSARRRVVPLRGPPAS